MAIEVAGRLEMLGLEHSVETALPAVPVGAAGGFGAGLGLALAAAAAGINHGLASQPAEAAWAIDLSERRAGDHPLRASLVPVVTGTGAVTADLAIYGAIPTELVPGALEGVAAQAGTRGLLLIKLADVACVAGSSNSGALPAGLGPRTAGDRVCATATVTATGALAALAGVEVIGSPVAGSGAAVVSVFDRGPLAGLLVLAARGAVGGATSVGVAAMRWR